MKRYVLAVAAVILIGGFSLYLKLGGHGDLIFLIEARQEQIIYGELFEGRPTEQRLEDLFMNARERSIETGKNLVVVNYDQDSVPLKQFIGTLQGPEDGKSRVQLKLAAGNYVLMEIRSDNLIMPTPDDIQSAAEKFATANGHKIKSELSYEMYQGDSVLIVMFRCY
ncbi:MAG: hypothetical protein AAF519_07910 [Bacteroidota bacterium]